METYSDMSSTRQTVTAFGNDSVDTQATVQSMRGRSRVRRWTPRRKYQQSRDPMLVREVIFVVILNTSGLFVLIFTIVIDV